MLKPPHLRDSRSSAVQKPNTGKRAINAALDLFQKRWVLKLLWELRSGPLTFRQLQAACGDLSSSVLNLRLADLREALLVERHGEGAGYLLTAQGETLLTAARPLLEWSVTWLQAVEASASQCSALHPQPAINAQSASCKHSV